MNQSIVRRGNHFIWVRSHNWILIDGEWFKRLEHSGYGDFVRVPRYEPMKFTMITDDCSPMGDFPEPLEWQRVSYQPSEFVPQFGRSKWFTAYLLARVPGRTDPRNRIVRMVEEHLRNKWMRRLWENPKWGWRLLPDGRIPCFWNYPDWIDDEYEAEGWIAR